MLLLLVPAKLIIFSALWQTYQTSGSTILAMLLLIGLLNTVVSLFYNLKIPYFMFFREKQEDTESMSGADMPVVSIHRGEALLVVLLVVPLLLWFFKAEWLLELINLILL